jgi:hypothetical protein
MTTISICAANKTFAAPIIGAANTSLNSHLSPQKINNIFKSEVTFLLPSLVAPLSWQDDGIVGQTNILSDPPFHDDHGDAIYLCIGCRLG